MNKPTLSQKLMLWATLRLISWVVILIVATDAYGWQAALIWGLLAYQHHLGRLIRGK